MGGKLTEGPASSDVPVSAIAEQPDWQKPEMYSDQPSGQQIAIEDQIMLASGSGGQGSTKVFDFKMEFYTATVQLMAP